MKRATRDFLGAGMLGVTVLVLWVLILLVAG